MENRIILRKMNKEIIALFPDVPGDTSPKNCSMFTFRKQYYADNPMDLIRRSVPAKQVEYKQLLKELSKDSHGYHKIKIVEKMSATDIKEREKIINRIKKAHDMIFNRK